MNLKTTVFLASVQCKWALNISSRALCTILVLNKDTSKILSICYLTLDMEFYKVVP